MIYEFEVLADIISPNTNKIIKKDITYKKTFNSDLISVEEYLDPKGKKIAKYCMVTEDSKCYKINKPYTEVVLLTQPIKVIGLIAKSKKYKNGRMV